MRVPLKRLGLIIFAAVFFFSWALPVSAHVLESDGSIGAVLHIDPDDDPIIGEPAYFFFDLKDSENKFKLENCICQAAILKNSEMLFSESVSASKNNSNSETASFTYTFPEKGIYTIEINGLSNNKSFEDFKLSYDFRVDRETQSKNLPTNIAHFTSLAIIVAVLIFIYIFNNRSKTPQK